MDNFLHFLLLIDPPAGQDAILKWKEHFSGQFSVRFHFGSLRSNGKIDFSSIWKVGALEGMVSFHRQHS